MEIITIYHVSILTEYKEYKTLSGLKSAYNRLLSKNPKYRNLMEVLSSSPEFKENFLRWNPYYDDRLDSFSGDCAIVEPYKDGWAIVRHFSVKTPF